MKTIKLKFDKGEFIVCEDKEFYVLSVHRKDSEDKKFSTFKFSKGAPIEELQTMLNVLGDRADVDTELLKKQLFNAEMMNSILQSEKRMMEKEVEYLHEELAKNPWTRPFKRAWLWIATLINRTLFWLADVIGKTK